MRRVCLAPMMDRTDRHFRFLLRMIAPRTLLYTEMITAFAILRGDADSLLAHDRQEHPLALQLGGSSASDLARATERASGFAFDEFNINAGCPSDRVQAGAFGAALMLEPAKVADCVRSMRDVTDQPVTVKTRIGVDHQDDYAFLAQFASAVAEAGCKTLIVHARKAWLKGLSPKQNREIPPLDYARVHQLKRDFPELEIIINGGIRTVEDVRTALGPADGVMIGRAACDTPLVMREIENELLGPGRYLAVSDVLDRYARYVCAQVREGQTVSRLVRPLSGITAGRPGARRWRRMLSTLPAGEAGAQQLSSEFKCLPDAAESRYNEPQVEYRR